jgi:hypothetical protein
MELVVAKCEIKQREAESCFKVMKKCIEFSPRQSQLQESRIESQRMREQVGKMLKKE